MSEERDKLIAALYTENPRTEIIAEPFEAYREAKAVNRSALVDWFDPDEGGCPYLFIMGMMFPHLMKDQSTPAWEEGSALHQFYLEPDTFHERHAILDADMRNKLFRMAQDGGSKADGFSKNLKTYQAWKKEMEEEGKPIIEEQAMEKFERMRKTFLKDQDIAAIMDAPHRTELSVYSGYRGPKGEWEKAIQMKARIDILPDDGDLKEAFDLKKARHSAPIPFAKEVANRRLDVQAAIYCGCLTWAGRPTTEFAFLAQEPEFPFIPAVHIMPLEWIRWGELHMERLLGELKECLSTNRFPSPGANVLLPPEWIAKQMESGG